MLHHFLTITIGMFAIVSGSALLSGEEKARISEGQPHQVFVKLAADQNEVSIGSPLVFTESISTDVRGRVTAVLHKVTRIGRYDSSLRRLINLEIEDFKSVSPVSVFYKMGDFDTAPHGLNLRNVNAKEKGTDYKVFPKKLGVFLICAEWHLEDGDTKSVVQSNPIVVVVRVPILNGKPATPKDEWIEDR